MANHGQGKIRLQWGDIWVKKGTVLQLASRADLDAMNRLRMEEEAEKEPLLFNASTKFRFVPTP